MRKVRLTRFEKTIEDNLLSDNYIDIEKEKFEEIAQAVSARKKDAVLNIRVNSRDIINIKQKAHHMGIKYQTFISELIHRIAQAH